MKQNKNIFLLFITALIWGVAFVAQSEGGDAVGPYSFNFIRFIIGGMALIPAIAIFDRTGITKNKPVNKDEKKRLMIAGISCGIALSIASNFQQVGINLGTEPGKAGFLTACYILIVPILGIFFGRKCRWNIWLGVVIALAGLYLLCIKGESGFRTSDIIVLICAFCFSVQIMLVDKFSPVVDCVRLSCIQFFVCGILTFIPMLVFELIPAGSLLLWAERLDNFDAWKTILYSGLLSCGVAYTLQTIGQKGVNPTIASLVMSLESVVAVLAGMIILKQMLSVYEVIGCVLIFTAIVLAQLTFGKKQVA